MERPRFSSRLASILTMIGVAIGLGNVWRFPYMMGKYGGSAFLAVFILLNILFAIPALMAEMTLGQMSGKGTLDALRLGFGRKVGGFFGWMLLIVVTIAGSYYAVVVGNVVFTSFFSIVPGFSPDMQMVFQELFSNGWLQYAVTLVLIALSLYVIHRGLVAGIEGIIRKVLPIFVIALTYMIIHALTLPGAITKFGEFLQPDFSALGFREIFAALGQTFFSIGLGGTFVVVYAGFLKKDENIPNVAFFTSIGDVGSSLMFGLFLIPSILVYGLNMTSGPNLIFNTLPQLIDVMPGGRFVGPLFLLSISFAGFISLVAAYQVPFTSLQNEWPSTSNGKFLWSIGICQAVLALPSSLFPSFIGPLDLIFGSGMQIFGSALCILGLTWGVSKTSVMARMFPPGPESLIRRFTFFWIKWIIPLALLAVLSGYLYDVIF